MGSDFDNLEKFRPYLRFLARVTWDRRLQTKLDPSDLVQQTLLLAYQSFGDFRGTSEAECAGWLRKILANVVAERRRHFNRNKRDLGRERPLEEVLAESSRRMSGFATDDPTPSKQFEFNERALRLAAAVEALPPDQQEAVMLHYWQGHSIPEIAQIMERSPAAVGGLVHRGLKRLRQKLTSLQ